MPSFSKRIQVAGVAAQKASRYLKKIFGTIKLEHAWEKAGYKQLVSEADLKAESLIVETLKKSFPKDGLFSEELGKQNETADYQWVIDPLDGSFHFLASVPIFGSSIALMRRDRVIGGVLTLPALDLVSAAEENKGAVLNGKAMSVSAINSVDKAFLVAGSEYSTPPTKPKYRHLYRRLLTSVNRTRNFGNALYTLLLVANGTADIGVLLSKINLYDIAAGIILVQEAGGALYNAEGGRWQPYDQTLIATNGKLSLEELF